MKACFFTFHGFNVKKRLSTLHETLEMEASMDAKLFSWFHCYAVEK